jgi:GTP-binding protein
VGRPNVGKSTLFNRIVGQRTAIVEDRARTTRDRLYAEAEWNGRRFMVVDTGGLEVEPGDMIEAGVQEQARLAIGEADLILFVVDAAVGLTPADAEAAELLRRATAPVIVAVNKADNEKRELEAAEFHQFGWDETHPIAASHGRGVADLLDVVVWTLPPETEAEVTRKRREAELDAAVDAFAERTYEAIEAGAIPGASANDRLDAGDAAALELDAAGGAAEAIPTKVDAAAAEAARWDAVVAAEAASDPPAIAFVGRPNVGKSSLLNQLLGEPRTIVSDVPGTTRDTIDTELTWGTSELVLIDTAGIRRRGKVAGGPAAERYSTLRALRAIGRADVAVLVIDAVEGLTAQDAHVAGYVIEEGRGLIVAVNKWDLVEDKTDRTFDQYVTWIRSETPFLDFAPVVSISALTGQRTGRVLELALDIWAERRKRVPTGTLNRVLRNALERTSPPLVKGRRPKIFYATQAAVAPPTFVFFASDAQSVHFSYRRYLENRLREAFGYDGTPIRLIFRDRASVQLPKRRSSSRPGARKPATRRPAAGKPKPARGRRGGGRR